jgi:hypothetical protein
VPQALSEDVAALREQLAAGEAAAAEVLVHSAQQEAAAAAAAAEAQRLQALLVKREDRVAELAAKVRWLAVRGARVHAGKWISMRARAGG